MLLHDVAATADGAQRHTATYDLAQRRQIGLDAVQPLRTLRAHAEPGHHLVEDQQHAVSRAQVPQPRQEPRRGPHQIHVAGDRLDDHRGDVLALLIEGLLPNRRSR